MIKLFSKACKSCLNKRSLDLKKYYSSSNSKKQSEAVIVSEIQSIKSFDEIPGPKIWPIIGSLSSIKGLGTHITKT
jgi:hypothetical protein